MLSEGLGALGGSLRPLDLVVIVGYLVVSLGLGLGLGLALRGPDQFFECPMVEPAIAVTWRID